MSQRSQLKFLTAIFISATVGNAFANGFALPDQDAFATSRGEAFVATADNPAAIYYNPAGIAQLKGDNFRGGIYGIYLDSTYQAPSSSKIYHSTDQYAAVPQIFYSHTFQGAPLSVGLGIYAPFGGNTDWMQATNFRQIAISGSLKYITVAPAVAWKIFPSLSLGAGAMVNYVHLETSQGFLTTQTSFTTNFFNFDGQGWSVGYNAGVLWQPVKQISIGANFRSSANVNLNGHTRYELQPITPDTHSPASMGMNFPWTAVGGISYRPTEKWNLEFDANYTDWSRFGTFSLHEQNPPSSLSSQNPTPVHFEWQGSWMYELGVTRYFDNGWHVSSGYAFNENSVPDKYYTPWAADLDRHFFSAGAGFNGKVFDFDAAVQIGYAPSHTVAGSKPSIPAAQFLKQSADGTYGFFSAAVFVTAGVHF